MNIISPKFSDEIHEIATMEGTVSEIEHKIKQLCNKVALDEHKKMREVEESLRNHFDPMSFDSMAKRVQEAA